MMGSVPAGWNIIIPAPDLGGFLPRHMYLLKLVPPRTHLSSYEPLMDLLDPKSLCQTTNQPFPNQALWEWPSEWVS